MQNFVIVDENMGLNEKYKHRHKPAKQGNSKYHQGYFYPKNPEKCLTPNSNIYRSGYELQFLTYCDNCPSILRYASEPIAIPYKNPVSSFAYCMRKGINPNDTRYWKTSMYNVDFWIEVPDGAGGTRKIFIEIKPYAQTIPPVKPDENAKPAAFKRYNKESMTFLQNNAKWKAAKEFCSVRGCEFMIVTERTLKRLGLQ